ncbi:MAG TPA: NAD(P)H-hydrate dehydratase, partial [Opitutales bacterium]|nr:NAD(P)H-hydrate dehydratase [Opitutales bacterium]
MPVPRAAHPILTCAEARAWEKQILGEDPEKAWAAMQQAGTAMGAAMLRDYVQWRPLPRDPRVLVLAGPGHNGGDALLAAREILRARPRGHIIAVLLDPLEKSKPLTQRAGAELAAHSGVELITAEQFLPRLAAGEAWDFTLAGLYGMGFRPPLSDAARNLISAINDAPAAAGFRAAVDLPSGVGDETGDLAFRADFTYATGIAKQPLFEKANAKWAGRIRYLDLGFFAQDYNHPRAFMEDILRPEILHSLNRLRDAAGDKRAYGHLLVIGGSRAYPGALMLNVLGALRAGAGLVTALTPFTLAPSYAAARPEAMWRACPEEMDGGHGGGTHAAARDLQARISAMLVGSGLGRGPGTQTMLPQLVKTCLRPLVLDADALMPKVLLAVAERPAEAGPVIITPHAGEFARIAGEGADLAEFCRKFKVITVLKGSVTRISDGTRTWCSTFGGPVLARGGSGDVLAGVIAALVAQRAGEPMLAAARGVVWHGLAADALARARGDTSALTSELASYLPEAL